jgi:hypothetical protein
MDEITITRDELAADVRIWLRVARQKEPHLLSNLSALKDERGYPDRKREDQAIFAFAEWLADKMHLSGKRIVRERSRSPSGEVEQTMAEKGIEPRPPAQVR